MSYAKIYIPGLLALIAFLLPSAAFAASATFFGPIVPEVCRTCACGFGGVLAIIQNSVNFVIALSVIIATVFLVWGGILYILSPANPESRSAANKILLNAVMGIVIVLSAWIIVDFVMKTLYGGTFGPWNSILRGGDECATAKTNTPLFSGNIFATPGTGTGEEAGQTTAGTATNDAATKKLSDAGISIHSSGNCSDKTKSNCTSLDGMRDDTINQIVALKQACGTGCSVTVTGGTEVGHSESGLSHESGYKVDIATGSSLDNYIQSMKYGGTRDGDPRYYDRCGNEYVKESSPSHWDITVSKGVCNPPKS